MPGAASEEPMADEVLVGHGDRVAIIMINRPQARNAISANGKLERGPAARSGRGQEISIL
jgi:hypothetical protein